PPVRTARRTRRRTSGLATDRTPRHVSRRGYSQVSLPSRFCTLWPPHLEKSMDETMPEPLVVRHVAVSVLPRARRRGTIAPNCPAASQARDSSRTWPTLG